MRSSVNLNLAVVVMCNELAIAPSGAVAEAPVGAAAGAIAACAMSWKG